MSELTAPRLETAPVEGSLRARMLGRAASLLGRIADRLDERATHSAYQPAHAKRSEATIDNASDTSVVDTAAHAAGYDLKSADATAALEAIVARQKQADQRQLYGLQREVNSRAARKDRRNPAYAATERSLIDTDEVSGDETTTALPELFDGIDSTAGYDLRSEAANEALDSIVARQERTEHRRAQGLSGEENDRAARKQRKNAAKAKREAAYAARESAQLGIDEEPAADVADSSSTVETAVIGAPEQPVYRGRHARTPEVNEQLEMFSWIDDEDDAPAAPRHAGAQADEGDLDFSWMEERSLGEEAALAEADAEATPKRTIREHIAALKNPADAALYWAARVQSFRSEWVRNRQVPKTTEQREKPAGRRRVAYAIGSVAGIAVLGAGSWAMSRGHDVSAMDASSFEFEPIAPTGGEDVAEQAARVQPIETTADTTAVTEATSTTSGGGSRAGGSGGSAETVGALGGEAIDPTAWNVPKGSGGEQLIQRLGSDRATWYENQDAFLKQFPNEAYRMNDGNVGLRPGRLSQSAIDFWTKAISK